MRAPYYEDLTTALYLGDCRKVMAEMPENSVDSIVTDPPYLLGFMGKDFDRQDGASSDPKKMQEWHRLWAVEALRVLKPGGHALVMGGTRTYHRMACGLEDTGFECRDCCMYLYGVGFPKSLDIAKALTKAELGVPQGGPNPLSPNTGRYKGGTIKAGHPTGQGFGAGPGQFLNGEEVAFDMEPTDAARQWEGWGTALKPSVEIIALCRKPLSEPTVAQNVLRWGVGGIWVDGARTPLSTTDRLRACVRGIRAHVGNANGDSTEGRDRGHNESLFVRSLRNKPSSWVGVSLSPSSNGTASVPHSPSLLDSLVGCPACLRLGDALAHLVQGASQARFPSRQYAHKHTRLATHEGGLACEEVRSHLSGIGPLSISDSSHPDVSLYDLLRVSEPGLQAAARYLEWSLGHSHTCAPVGLSFVRPDRQTLSGIQLLRQTYVEIGSLDEDSASRSPLMYVFAVPLIVTNVWHYVEEALQRSGRWPANLLHDGSDEVLALFPNSKGLSEGDGSAARFFYDTGRGERDLLLGCAKTIMESWNVELANTADDNSSLPSEYAASALSRAVTGASHGDHQLSGLAGLSTSVTPRLLRHLCESVIIATLCIENESLPVSFHLGTVRLSGNLAKFAGTQGRIGTTMITASPTSFAGCAVIATLSCTRHSTVRGEVDYPSRLFYAAKASRSERDYGLENMPNHTPGEVTGGRQEGSAGLDSPRAGAGRTSGGHNPHPTVKPLSLMRWLCRLVTPPGGVVLDPFIGSGTTRLACIVEGFECIGIDQEQHYLDIAANRMVKPEDSV